MLDLPIILTVILNIMKIVFVDIAEAIMVSVLLIFLMKKFNVVEFKKFNLYKIDREFLIKVFFPSTITAVSADIAAVLGYGAIKPLIAAVLSYIMFLTLFKVKNIYGAIRLLGVQVAVILFPAFIEIPVGIFLSGMELTLTNQIAHDLPLLVSITALKWMVALLLISGKNGKRGKSLTKIVAQDKALLTSVIIAIGGLLLYYVSLYIMVFIDHIFSLVNKTTATYIGPILSVVPIGLVFLVFYVIRLLTGDNLFKRMNESDRFKVLTGFMEQMNSTVSSIHEVDKLMNNFMKMMKDSTSADNVSILMYDNMNQSTNLLKVMATSLTKPEDLKVLSEHVNTTSLHVLVEGRKSFSDQSVDTTKYPYLNQREVRSMMCIPLYTNTDSLGLILLESRHPEMFDQEINNAVMVLGNQLGIILENSKLYTKIKEMAVTDGLTGINNRISLQTRLPQEFEKAKEAGQPLAVVICDIDKFKSINDTYGHLFGDKALKQTALTLKDYITEGQFVARYGGEEFVLLLPGYTAEQVYSSIDTLREKIKNKPVKDCNYDVNMSMSFGIASYPDICKSEDELLLFADRALYHSKDTGRNKVTVYSDSINTK